MRHSTLAAMAATEPYKVLQLAVPAGDEEQELRVALLGLYLRYSDTIDALEAAGTLSGIAAIAGAFAVPVS